MDSSKEVIVDFNSIKDQVIEKASAEFVRKLTPIFTDFIKDVTTALLKHSLESENEIVDEVIDEISKNIQSMKSSIKNRENSEQ